MSYSSYSGKHVYNQCGRCGYQCTSRKGAREGSKHTCIGVDRRPFNWEGRMTLEESARETRRLKVQQIMAIASMMSRY